jgi:hypothetical protein
MSTIVIIIIATLGLLDRELGVRAALKRAAGHRLDNAERLRRVVVGGAVLPIGADQPTGGVVERHLEECATLLLRTAGGRRRRLEHRRQPDQRAAAHLFGCCCCCCWYFVAQHRVCMYI